MIKKPENEIIMVTPNNITTYMLSYASVLNSVH